jgi:hypothetical protein
MLYGSVFIAVGLATTLLGPVGFFRDDSSRGIFFTISTGICSKYVRAFGVFRPFRAFRFTEVVFMTASQ